MVLLSCALCRLVLAGVPRGYISRLYCGVVYYLKVCCGIVCYLKVVLQGRVLLQGYVVVACSIPRLFGAIKWYFKVVLW